MFTVGDFYAVLDAGTPVTIEDDKRYYVLNEPFDNIGAVLPDDFTLRPIKSIRAGIKTFRVELWNGEE